MDLELLSKILRGLILEHNRVSLPGMGSFIAEKAPSVFSDRAMVIHPPFRRILFRPSEIWNDGLLETKYSQEKNCEIEVAKDEIAEFVKLLKVDLKTDKSYKIPDFGTMRATEQNDYFFVADKNLFNYIETFGLEPVNIKFLPRRGEVESLDGKPIENFFKKDIRAILSVANSTLEEQPVAKEQPIVQEKEPLLAEEKPVAKEQPIVQEKEPLLAEEKPVAKEQPAKKEQLRVEKHSTSKFIKNVIIVLTVIFSLILIIALLVLFKDELRPFWEWVLYSKEEREFLRSSFSSSL